MTEVRFSAEVAWTRTLPSAVTVAVAIYACVFLVIESTSTPAPKPASPPAASAPAVLKRVSGSAAVTITPGPVPGEPSGGRDGRPRQRRRPASCTLRSLTATEPAMAAEPEAEPPTAIVCKFWNAVADDGHPSERRRVARRVAGEDLDRARGPRRRDRVVGADVCIGVLGIDDRRDRGADAGVAAARRAGRRAC